MLAAPDPARDPSATVLVVDNDAGFARSVQILLEDEGCHRVVVARGLEDALQRLEVDTAVRVVLSDFHLPGADGLELLRRLRERRCEAAFFLVSAHLSPLVMDAAERLGVRRCLGKPINPEQLLDVVQAAAGGTCRSPRAADDNRGEP
jgi:two-component system, LuxR family, response regulator FixJ